ncbi:hypothetical protein [Actinoplanes awajinensis]|uniref:DUF3558 domain-containing protein n=1 Tax=Actinoplanes awajinensis subsp. mycoplanecinus TaxID=135947 RepID=A0A101JBW2_9ACTN|nr:hypothetical protein [Actinoplanes awajinensis]KUL23946.1 hypothetical protein ADL15_44845 [Actinoplanes awajinensis subsp. mycoplanecinus]
MRRPFLIAITGLVLACGLSSCTGGDADDPGGEVFSKEPCLQPEELRDIAKLPILSQQPADTRLMNTYEDCDIDGLTIAARTFETGEKAGAIAEFYRASAKKYGWTTNRPDASPYPDGQVDGDDFYCASAKWKGSPVYLEVQWPDADSGILDGREEGTVFQLTLGRQPRYPAACPPPAA